MSNCKFGPWVLTFQEFVRAFGEDLGNSGAVGDEIVLKVIACLSMVKDVSSYLVVSPQAAQAVASFL